MKDYPQLNNVVIRLENGNLALKSQRSLVPLDKDVKIASVARYVLSRDSLASYISTGDSNKAPMVHIKRVVVFFLPLASWGCSVPRFQPAEPLVIECLHAQATTHVKVSVALLLPDYLRRSLSSST